MCGGSWPVPAECDMSEVSPSLSHPLCKRSDQSCSCQPMPQPGQHQILNPLSEARDPTYILMDTRVFFCCTTTETPRISSYQSFLAKSCGGSVVDTMQIIKSLETIQEGICYYKNIKKRPHTEDWMGLPENALFKWHT